MPQIFDKFDELKLVDWDTIVVYTCVNPKCLPEFANEEFYLPEFSFVQFSLDFQNVRYGEDQEVAKVREIRKKQMDEQETLTKEQEQEILKAQDEIVKELLAEEEASEAKKKKKKNKKKENADKIQNEVQEELGDLLNTLNLGKEEEKKQL